MDMIKIDIREESEQIRRIFKNKDLVSVEELLATIEEQDDEISHLEDKYKDLENDMIENYTHKPFNPYEEYGINERDFH